MGGIFRILSIFVLLLVIGYISSGLSDGVRLNSSYEMDVTWYAPFYSGGGYCSEAMAFMFAAERVGFKNFSISHHGDSVRQMYLNGLTSVEKNGLHYYDVINKHKRIAATKSPVLSIEVCHSEPGAWHAPTPRYHTVRCPSERRQTKLFSSDVVTYNIGRTMFETDRIPNGWVDRLQYMDEIWVPTEFSREVFVHAGVPSEKVQVVGEAVDTDFYKPVNYFDLTAVQQEELGLPPSHLISPYRTVFLFVGKFETRKGLSELFHAYQRAFPQGTTEEVLLLILTTAYHSTEDLQSELNALLVSEGLSVSTVPRFLLLTDVKQAGMPYLYSLASALVIPSHGEGWGRPHMEAMSCGTPVLATNWSGPTAFIQHDHTGYLISIEAQLVPAEGWTGHFWAQPNRTDLIRLLQHVHQHPDEARRVGVQAREAVVGHYGLSAMGAELVQHFERIHRSVLQKLLPTVEAAVAADGGMREKFEEL